MPSLGWAQSNQSLEDDIDLEKIDEELKNNTFKSNLPEPSQEDKVFGEVINYLETEEYIIEQEKKRQQLEHAKNFSQKVSDLHSSISDNIVTIADKIDSFFINQNIIEGRNRSNIRLTNTASIIDRYGYENDFDFKIRLRLPHLKRRIQIEFEDESLIDETVGSRDNLSRNTTLRNNQQGGSRGALSYYQKLLGFETKWSSGVELRSDLIVFARFRFSKDFVINEKQKFTFIHDVFDDTSKNRGQLGILNYDYSITKKLLLRQFNEQSYRDINNVFQTTHGFAFYHQISDRNFLSYSYRVESLNPPGISTFFLNTHNLNISFRRRLYRDHLFYEAGPGLILPKQFNFEALPAAFLKIELIFGNI